MNINGSKDFFRAAGNIALAMLVLVAGSAFAAESMGEQATNPVAPLVSVRLQDGIGLESYNADGYSNVVDIQLVNPFSLPFEAVPQLLLRTTIPWVTTPSLGDGPNSRRDGMADTVMNFFFVPSNAPKGWIYAVGPTITVPTAGDNVFGGAGQWQAGPSFVFMYSGIPKLQLGALMFHQWDIGSTRSGAQDVSKFNIQPIITKHLNNGWYVGAPDQPNTYDNETGDWTLNIGGLVGRVWKPKNRKHPIQVYAGVYYNSEQNPGVVATKWTFKLNYSLLLPTK